VALYAAAGGAALVVLISLMLAVKLLPRPSDGTLFASPRAACSYTGMLPASFCCTPAGRPSAANTHPLRELILAILQNSTSAWEPTATQSFTYSIYFLNMSI
jgi:hypothetical protein